VRSCKIASEAYATIEPYLFLVLGFPPAPNSVWNILLLPSRAAKCMGVIPYLSAMFGLAP